MEEKVEASKHLPPSLSTSLVSATSPNIPCAAHHDRMGQVSKANQKATSLKIPTPLTLLATQHPVICAVLPSNTCVAPPDEMFQVSRANCRRPYTQVSVLLDGIKIPETLLASVASQKMPLNAPSTDGPSQASNDGPSKASITSWKMP